MQIERISRSSSSEPPNRPFIKNSLSASRIIGQVAKLAISTQSQAGFSQGQTLAEKMKQAKGEREEKSTSLILRTYSHLKYAEDAITEKAINSDWKALLLNNPDPLQQPLLKEAFCASINFIFSQTTGDHFLPEKIIKSKSTINFEEIEKKIPYDRLFLEPIRASFINVKKNLDKFSSKKNIKTQEGERFYSQINSLISCRQFDSLISQLKTFKTREKKLYKIFKTYLGFKNKRFIKILKKWHYQARKEGESLLLELKIIHQDIVSIKKKCVINTKTLEVETIDRIPTSEVLRCISPHHVLNLPLKINKEDIIPLNDSYLKGVIHRLNKIGFNPQIDPQVSDLEENLFKQNVPINCDRILKLCTINAWALADKSIRETFKKFYEIPFMGKCEQGMRCRIKMINRDQYSVSQYKIYAIYKRRIPTDPDCTTLVGEAIGFFSFKWKASYTTAKGFSDTLILRKWKMNKTGKYSDQLLFIHHLMDSLIS